MTQIMKKPSERKLHLYKLTQYERTETGAIEYAIVAAYDNVCARRMHPEQALPGNRYMKKNFWDNPSPRWASSPRTVHTFRIGEASTKFVKPTVISTSYKVG